MKHLTQAQIKAFQARLEEEKARLEEELASITARNPANPTDWSPITDEASGDTADIVDRAEAITDIEENEGIATSLEEQLKEVMDALQRIIDGTYGIDEKTGEPIVVERLEANPSARTNI